MDPDMARRPVNAVSQILNVKQVHLPVRRFRGLHSIVVGMYIVSICSSQSANNKSLPHRNTVANHYNVFTVKCL